jgi:hypothetical protein
MHTFQRTLLCAAAAAALVFNVAAHAQGAAPVDPEKQKLIDHLLAVYHPEARVILEAQRVGTQAMEQAAFGLQGRVSKQKQEQAMKDIGADVQKYVDTATPLVQGSAKKLVGPSVGPILAQNFTNDEIKQLIAIFESPVNAKFQKIVPEMERAVGEKVSTDVGPELNKQITTLKTDVGTRMRAAAAGN